MRRRERGLDILQVSSCVFSDTTTPPREGRGALMKKCIVWRYFVLKCSLLLFPRACLVFKSAVSVFSIFPWKKLAFVFVYLCVRMCVVLCVRAYVCVRASVCVCVHLLEYDWIEEQSMIKTNHWTLNSKPCLFLITSELTMILCSPSLPLSLAWSGWQHKADHQGEKRVS